MKAVNIKIKKKVFNPAYLPYLETNYRYEIFYGGAGSGKSYFIAQKYIYRILKRKTLNLLVVRQTGDTNRDSTFALFKQVINRWGLSDHFKINESDLRIRCKLNGNEIIFKGLDDTEKLKSITFSRGELTDVWMEEASETEEASFNQLDIRLRGGKDQKQITVSFNPVNINHWLKKFVDAKQANKMSLHTTYKDNKFIDDNYKQLLESFKDKDPYYYAVYCLGEWGVLGKTVFNAKIVTERISQIREKKPIKQGFFIFDYENEKIIDDSIKWIDAEDGYISIYEDVQNGYPYVIGGDTAGDGSDHFTGQVLNNITGNQAAVLRHQFDEDLYTRQMYCMGKYYNVALEGIEVNFSTYPVKELARLGYTRQFVREKIDTYTGKTEPTFGFRTDKLSRPLIIASLVQIVREHPELMNDIMTLQEMLTFVRNEKGRPEAQLGSFDDLILGLAIAHYIRPQQGTKVKIPEPEKNDIQADKERMAKRLHRPRRRLA